MAFNQYNLERVHNQQRGGFDLFVYRTDDTIAEVTTTGYFNTTTFGFKSPGQSPRMIKCVCSDGTYDVSWDYAGSGVASVVGRLSLDETYATKFKSLYDAGKVKAHLYGNSLIEAVPNAPMVASLLSDGNMKIVEYSGKGGFNSAAVLNKMQDEGFDPDANVVFFQEGTNDASGSVSLSEHISNMKAMADFIIANNRVPVMILTTPDDNATYSDELTEMWYYERILAESMGIAFFDPYRLVVDTDGGYISAYTTDGTHMTREGYTITGEQLYNDIKDGTSGTILPRTNDGHGMFGSNVLMLTDSNADGLPDGWLTLNFVSTDTLIPATFPARGNMLSIDYNQTGDGQIYRVVNTGYSIGDRIRCTGFVKLESSSNTLLQIFVRCNGVVVDNYCCAAGSDIPLSFFEREFVVPEGTTDLRVFVRVKIGDGTPATGTLTVGGIDLYNLTTAQAQLPE